MARFVPLTTPYHLHPDRLVARDSANQSRGTRLALTGPKVRAGTTRRTVPFTVGECETGLAAAHLGRAPERQGAMTFPRVLARCTHGAVNKMTLHLAGHAAFADLEHVGRKSGTVRHTPVRAFRTGDTVLIGLNFGRQSDWYQNIKAAGTCRIRLRGRQLTLGAPVLVPATQATRDMPWLFGFTLRHVVHTAECVQLPVLH